MRPADLKPGSFSGYPPRARALAVQWIALFRQLPLPLLPILLRELSSFDWRFPLEQRKLIAQLQRLADMPQAERSRLLASFESLSLPALLGVSDWVNDAAGYMEQLTAALWSTRQMPAFRGAAKAYAERVDVESPSQSAASSRFIATVLEGSLGTREQRLALYGNLRKHGVLFTKIDSSSGWKTLLAEMEKRQKADPQPYGHWYIEGGLPPEGVPGLLTNVSYGALEPTRRLLLERARQMMSAQHSGPEELRTLMARLTPDQVGLDHDRDPALAHFQLSLLTEGSGTQVFSTTFVQWAARECLRRAEPQSLLARFTARQHQQGMNELLTGAPSLGPDPESSLVDADQAVYYTWINLQRLPNAGASRFIAWQEGQPTVVAIGPGLPAGTTSDTPYKLQQVLDLLS